MRVAPDLTVFSAATHQRAPQEKRITTVSIMTRLDGRTPRLRFNDGASGQSPPGTRHGAGKTALPSAKWCKDHCTAGC